MTTPLEKCLRDRNPDFPSKVSKYHLGTLLKHLASCSRGVKYSEFQLDDFLDDTVDPKTGRRGMRLGSTETVWITFSNDMNFFLKKYELEFDYSNFNPKKKTLRNLRDYLWDKKIKSAYKAE